MPTGDSDLIAFTTRPVPRVKVLPGEVAAKPRLRVLIIDDTPEDRMVVRLALEAQGFMLNEVDNGERGLKAVEALRPDCILLDYHLPDLDGFEVLQALRRPDGEMQYPVVMLTDFHNGNAAAKLLKAGAFDYLAKQNLNEDSLRHAVTGAVERFRFLEERRKTEERNTQLAAIVMASADAIFSVGLDHIVRTWNPGATELFGYTEAEAVGRSIDELIVPDNRREERAQLFDAVVANQHAVYAESVRRRKDGSLLPVEINVSPMLNARGHIVAISIVMRDISERRDHEAALRESEQRLSLALDSSATGVWDWNLATDVVAWSGHIHAIFGVDTFAGTKDAFAQLVHPDDRDRIWAAVATAISTRQFYEAEFRIVRPSGEVRWVTNRGLAQYDDMGNPVRLLGTVIDVTERKLTEEALRNSEGRLTQILNNVNTFIGLVDTDGIVIEANTAALAAAGITREDAVGRCFKETPWWRVPAEFKQQLEIALAHASAGKTARCDLQYRAADDQIRWVDFQVAPVLASDGSVVAIVPSGTDITERKLLEARQKMLADELQHRSKNLLAVVQSIAARTLTTGRSIDDARMILTARIQALKNATDLLSNAAWKGAPIKDVVERGLKPFTNRFSIEGEHIVLSPSATQGFALVIHELGTNAHKHGAFSKSKGGVAIRWSVEGGADAVRFVFRWQELGGPRVTAPKQTNFGTQMLNRAIRGSEVRFDYAADGLIFSLAAPLAAVVGEVS